MHTLKKNIDLDDGGFGYTVDRELDAEAAKATHNGYATTKQGWSLVADDPRLKRLAKTIDLWRSESRHTRRHNRAWEALKVKDWAAPDLAFDLLVAGVTSCYAYENAPDKEVLELVADNAFTYLADWIGQGLGFRKGELRPLVGALGIDLLATLDDIFQQDEDGIIWLKLTPETDQVLTSVIERGIGSNPYIFPMLSEPEPWTQVRTGPLSHTKWASTPLLDRHKSNIKVARNAIANGRMQPVLDAVNSLGRVELAINPHALYFVQNIPDVIKPLPRQPWLRDRFLAQEDGQAQYRAVTLKIAAELAKRGSFRLPQELDFRGRVYSISHFAYSREDAVRGLIQFAQGVEMAPEDLPTLKAHVAGMADGLADGYPIAGTIVGTNKPSRLRPDERVKWVNANLNWLYYAGYTLLAREPIAAEFVFGLDTPVQLLIACAELVKADRVWAQGGVFRTRLPIKYDACCSGLQHLATLVRSQEARLANAVPSEQPEDLYLRVAEECYAACEPVTTTRGGRTITYHVMRGPDDRKLVKRSTMTHYYGSPTGGWVKPDKPQRKPKDGAKPAFNLRPVGKTAQIVEELKSRRQSPKGAKELAKAVTAANKKLAPQSQKVLTFLKGIARAYAGAGKQFRWDTGLPVISAYYVPDIKRLSTIIEVQRPGHFIITGERKPGKCNPCKRGPNKLVRVRKTMKKVVGDTDIVDEKAAVKGAAPNFVHSLDAYFLHLVANACAAEHIPLLAIHDCFAVTAPNAKRLNQILREQFRKLHSRDFLAEVLDRAKRELPKNTKLPKLLPPKGDLDINLCLDAVDMFK